MRPSYSVNFPKTKVRVQAMSGLPGLLAPWAKAVIFPRAVVSSTSRLSYSPEGADNNTIPFTVTASRIAIPPFRAVFGSDSFVVFRDHML